MLNLDGSYRNAGKFEVELFLRLPPNSLRFIELYLRIVRAARTARLAGDDVPDFIGVLDTPAGMELLGQDEIGSTEVGIAIEEQAAAVQALRTRLDLTEVETDRLVEQRVRLGQHRFAGQVLADYEYRCGFCGFAPGPLTGSRLLLASHIKPWRDSTGRERLDRRNGIAACPTHDAAFDGGLLTVNGGRRIHRTGRLRELIVSDHRAETFFGESTVVPTLLVPPGSDGPRRRYLDYHREFIFRREGPEGAGHP
jgi:putative restriction endonuclease